MVRALLCTCFLLTGLAITPSASAWESDVHYGLTKWLAIQAGFSEGEAEEIASGNEDMDTSFLSAVSLVFKYACFGWRGRTGTDKVREIHFPSDAAPPGEPKSRAVSRDSRFAQDAILDILRKSKRSDPAQTRRKFGEKLHAAQDSWSHEGVPGIPRLCSQEYAWAHPDTRGGWDQHHADQTYPWPPRDTLETARTTYSLLQQLHASQKPSPAKAGARWATLQPQIEEFQAARTIAAKAVWFRARAFSDVTFLFGISLPLDRTRARFEPSTLRRTSAPNSPPAKPVAPPEVYSLFDKVFLAWFATDPNGMWAELAPLIAVPNFQDSMRGLPPTVSKLWARVSLQVLEGRRSWIRRRPGAW